MFLTGRVWSIGCLMLICCCFQCWRFPSIMKSITRWTCLAWRQDGNRNCRRFWRNVLSLGQTKTMVIMIINNNKKTRTERAVQRGSRRVANEATGWSRDWRRSVLNCFFDYLVGLGEGEGVEEVGGGGFRLYNVLVHIILEGILFCGVWRYWSCVAPRKPWSLFLHCVFPDDRDLTVCSLLCFDLFSI